MIIHACHNDSRSFFVNREKSELSSLQRAYRAFNLAATPKDAENSVLIEKSNKLKEFIREYFKVRKQS
jgi:hypothetical protein